MKKQAASKAEILCSFCGEILIPEQAANPMLDKNDGKPCCDDCFHEKFEFTCFWCGNYEDEDYMDKILVITEECGGLPAGTYRILELPYFTSNYFSMWWDKSALERIGGIPPGFIIEEDDYPSGHLCSGCAERVLTVRNFGRPEFRALTLCSRFV